MGIEATRTETHSSNQVQETTQSKDKFEVFVTSSVKALIVGHLGVHLHC